MLGKIPSPFQLNTESKARSGERIEESPRDVQPWRLWMVLS